MTAFAKTRNLFRRKPLTDDELRRYQEAAIAKERLGEVKEAERRRTVNDDEFRRH
jgi:hypothetical protein